MLALQSKLIALGAQKKAGNSKKKFNKAISLDDDDDKAHNSSSNKNSAKKGGVTVGQKSGKAIISSLNDDAYDKDSDEGSGSDEGKDELNESVLSAVTEDENEYFKSKLIYQKRALFRKNLTL